MLVGDSRPLLRAKLLVPTVPPAAVDRSRLHDRLSGAAAARLTTVVAPAGWGKTTLLAGWARSEGTHDRVAWLSLDEADDEPVRFWSYALAALEAVAPHLTEESSAALRAPGLDPVGVALAALLNALTSTEETHVLVLDDYHVLRDSLVHQSVEFLLSYLPPALRLVIASRMDPPLPLARMRARGELEEIRVADLRCTESEGIDLISGVSHVSDLPAKAGERLVQRTEGWPAGLHLAALALRGGDPGAVADHLGENGRHVLDYFAAEVLPSLDPRQRELLVRTSVLERLSGPLCDAALATTGSAELLDQLHRAGLFVSSLGGGWYRCHRLFREVLRRELDVEGTGSGAEVLARAADWFLDEGRLEEAVEHRLAAGDHRAALDLMVDRGRWFLDHGASAAFLVLGERLAQSVTDARLFVSLAVAAGECGKPEATLRWLREAEPLIDSTSKPLPEWRSLRGQADTGWAMFGFPGDQEAALRHADRAVELEDDPSLPGYLLARQVRASTLWGSGRLDEAVEVLRECWRSPVRREVPAQLVLQAAGQLTALLIEQGQLAEARRVLREVQELADAAERTWGKGAAVALAGLRLSQARLTSETDVAASVPLFEQAVEFAEDWGWATLTLRALAGLASAQWAVGDKTAARTTLDRAREVADSGEVRPVAVHQFEDLERRIGRGAASTARAQGGLMEELTDRELSILRALRGPLTAREIGGELYLSINTVKGYTKSLYRKLDVVTRADAVRRGHELGLI